MRRAAAFMRRVDVGPGCWEWLGGRQSGYGQWSWRENGRQRGMGAHRIAYQFLVGPIPEGKQIHHTCGNRACCNPDHMEALTPLRHAFAHAAMKETSEERAYGEWFNRMCGVKQAYAP